MALMSNSKSEDTDKWQAASQLWKKLCQWKASESTN